MATAIGIPGLIPVGGSGAAETLQETYEASAPATITMAPATGAILITDDGTLPAASTMVFHIQDSAGRENLSATRDYLDLGFQSAAAGNPSLIRFEGTALNRMRWWPTDRVFTSSQGAMMQLDGTFELDYAGGVSFGALGLIATIQHNQAGFGFNHGLLFNHGNTYRNLLNTAVNYGPLQGFIDQPTIQVNRTTAGTITMGQFRSFLSQPAFERTTTNGTLSVTTVGQFQAFGLVDTGATVATWNRVQLGPFVAGSGIITNLRHIVMVNETQPTNVTGLRSEVSAAGGGTRWFVNHLGTAESNFGGAINLGAGATVDVSLSRGAANRLDLASGDSFRIVLGSLQFAGTAEQISRTAGELLLTGANVRTSAALEIDGALNHDGATLGVYGTAPVTQPVALGTIAYTPGAGGPMDDAGTSTGGVGASGYTFGDIVRCLKEIGAIAP